MGRFAMTLPNLCGAGRRPPRSIGRTIAVQSQHVRPYSGPRVVSLAITAIALLATGCGEGYRDAPPPPAATSKGSEKTTAFKQGCLALRKSEPKNLLLQRLAKLAGQKYVVCRKISSALEKRTALDLAATEDVEQVSDASLIFTLTKLSDLSLADNRLANLKGIRKLTALGSLDVSGNVALGQADEGGESPSWQAVGRLPLRVLNIAMTKTDNLAPFTTLYFLESLDITGNDNITDLSPIGRLEKLTALEATGIALGTTTKATRQNCPVDAKSPAVKAFCQALVKPPGAGEGYEDEDAGNGLAID